MVTTLWFDFFNNGRFAIINGPFTKGVKFIIYQIKLYKYNLHAAILPPVAIMTL